MTNNVLPKEHAPNRPTQDEHLAHCDRLGLSSEYTAKLYGSKDSPKLMLTFDVIDSSKKPGYRKAWVVVIWPHELPPMFLNYGSSKAVVVNIPLTPEQRDEIVKMDLINAVDVRFDLR